MKDGHLNKCIDCVRAYALTHRGENLDKIRAYDRARGNRQTPEYLAEYRSKHPKRYKATSMINNAIRSGKLFSEPCFVCGDEKTVGHHDDYDKPLNVRWLCQPHHHQWHAKNGPGLNG